MNDAITDERAVFYLKHKSLIETWASVRDDVVREAHRFFLSLQADLEERAPGLGGDVRVWVRDGSWSNVGLYRQEWYGETGPLISCTTEWSSKATFDDGMRLVGLRIHREDEDGRSIRDFVANEVSDLRGKSGFVRTSQIWPVYREAASPTQPEFWNDLSGFREALVAEVVEAWTMFEKPAAAAFEVWKSDPLRIGRSENG